MQKRMSTTLRAYKKQLCRAEWSDAKDVVSPVCLTYIIVDQIQTYSRYPVRNNRGKTEATKEAIWTLFFISPLPNHQPKHSVINTPLLLLLAPPPTTLINS